MKNYLVLGHGGIGSALAKLIHAQNNSVIVISRQTSTEQPYKIITFDEIESVLANDLPDYIINTIGLLHDHTHQPEKNIKQLNDDWLKHSIDINVMPTVNLIQRLLPMMSRSSTLKLLTLSARVASVTENQLGGWYSYRMSKAALNMLVRNIGIEWKRQYPQAAIYGYHPGTVDTRLSKPFQTNVPADQLFTPAQAANYLLTVLHQLTLADSGYLFDWQGKRIVF